MKRTLLSLFLLALSVSNAQVDSASLRVRPNSQTTIKQYVNTPISSSLQLNDNFTLECWVKVPAVSEIEEYLIETYGTGGGGYVLRINNGRLMCYAIGATSPSIVSVNTLTLNQWHHVAATFDDASNVAKLYIDGVLDLTGSLNVDNFTTTTDLRIGARGDDTDVNDLLYMDEVRIWNVVRTDAEIASNMNNCLVGNESGLVLYYDFEDVGNGNMVTDKSPNSNDGTVIANVDPRAPGVFACCFVNTQVSVTANVLTATMPGASYQWIDCSNNSPINGATNQSYTATAIGDYACVINNGFCADTSSCHSVSSIGLNVLHSTSVGVYPNPTKGTLHIEAIADIELITIYDVSGALVQSETSKQFTVDTLKNGVYLIHILTNNGIAVSRFVKE